MARCPKCGKIKKTNKLCRSCALRQSWSQGKRRQTIESLKRRYGDPQLRKHCSDILKERFKNEEILNRLKKTIKARNDGSQKSQRMKKWWANPQNRAKMLKIFKSEKFKIKISTRMKLHATTPLHHQLSRKLRKLGIPYRQRFIIACHEFDFILYPESSRPILIDVIDDHRKQRTYNARRQFIDLMHLAYDYHGITKELDLDHWLLQVI